jgi:hypothetical protein
MFGVAAAAAAVAVLIAPELVAAGLAIALVDAARSDAPAPPGGI